MYRISLIISELYNKYLPSAEKADIRLDLDIIDDQWTTDESDLQELKSDIDSISNPLSSVRQKAKSKSASDHIK